MPKPAWHHDKRSRQERGYGAAWDRLRVVILKRDGYRCRCEECARTGTLKAATEVDHRISKVAWQRAHGNFIGCDDPSNLSAIHADCHKRKSLEERGFRSKAVVLVGLDGYPLVE